MDHIDKFKALTVGKQKAIIDAAMDEFANSGFALASTNTMIKNAGISKGSLFYYFGSKEQLYLYLIHKSEKKLFERMEHVFENMSPDIISRLRDIANAYLDLYIEEPEAFKFLMTLTNPENKELANQYRLQAEDDNQKKLQLMFSGLDVTGLRLDMDGALKIITWTMSGLKDSLFNKPTVNIDAIKFKKDFWNEFELLLDVLGNGIYRREE